MKNLYETWLEGLQAEQDMEALAGYNIGWNLLAEGKIEHAESRFKSADEYCANQGWRLPVQVRWKSEISRVRRLQNINTER